MKKNAYKAVLLVALGLAGMTSAHAGSSDMLLGFNDAAGPLAAQNDFIVDLGPVTSFTANSSLGGTFSSALFSTAFGADANALNNVAAGIVEGLGGTVYPKSLFLSYDITPPDVQRSPFNNSMNSANGAGTFIGVNGSDTDGGWSGNVAVSPSEPGFNIGGNDVTSSTGANPLKSLVNGQVTLTLWESTLPSALGTPSVWSQIGTFEIDANNSTWGFTGASVVPEPTTLSLLGSAGLLLMALRRKSLHKNA